MSKPDRVEWRAVAQDIGSTADAGRWYPAKTQAEADLAALKEDHVEPPYDDMWLERRTVGEPERVDA